MIAKTDTQHYSNIADAVRYSLDGTQYESSLAQARAEIAEDNELFEDISEAIQSKTGQVEPYAKDELASTITSELVVPNLIHLEVTPTTSQQTITPEAPNIGFSSVTVEAGYPAPSGVVSISRNGSVSISGFAEALVGVNELRAYFTDNLSDYIIDLSGVTAIPIQAFYLKVSLKDIVMPDVITIGEYAFMNCTALRITELPQGLVTIGSQAFRGCVGIPYLDMSHMLQIPAISANVFLNTTFPFYFADQTQLDAYAAATNWSTYANRFQIKPSGV